MLSTLILKLFTKKENFKSLENVESVENVENVYLRKYIILFIIVVVIELCFMYYSLWCLFMLNLKIYATVFLLLLMLIPDIGTFFSLLIIIYFHCYSNKKKNKIET